MSLKLNIFFIQIGIFCFVNNIQGMEKENNIKSEKLDKIKDIKSIFFLFRSLAYKHNSTKKLYYIQNKKTYDSNIAFKSELIKNEYAYIQKSFIEKDNYIDINDIKTDIIFYDHNNNDTMNLETFTYWNKTAKKIIILNLKDLYLIESTTPGSFITLSDALNAIKITPYTINPPKTMKLNITSQPFNFIDNNTEQSMGLNTNTENLNNNENLNFLE